MTDETQFTLGEHSARLDGMEARIKEIQATQHADAESFNKKLDRIVSYVDRQRGGMWVLTGVSTVVGAIAALIVEWVKK